MITTTQMYWLVILDSIVHASIALAVISLLVSLAAMSMACELRRFFWLPVVMVGVFFLSVAVGTFVPTTKQAAAIVIVPKIVNNEKVQMVGNQLYDLAVDWMRSLRPSKTGDK